MHWTDMYIKSYLDRIIFVYNEWSLTNCNVTANLYSNNKYPEHIILLLNKLYTDNH